MTNLQRWTVPPWDSFRIGDPVEDDNGDWVLAEDVAALEKKLAQLESKQSIDTMLQTLRATVVNAAGLETDPDVQKKLSGIVRYLMEIEDKYLPLHP